MKVALSSNPDIIVDLRQPTFGDLKRLEDVNDNLFIKNELVRSCCSQNIDNFTTLDRDYLFLLCCSSIYKGKISPKLKCKCGEVRTYTVNFDEFEVFDIVPGREIKIRLFIGWRFFRFRVITVAEEEWCAKKAISWEGYSEDLIGDLIISKVIYNKKFDYSSVDAFYKTFKKLPFRAFLIAQNFDKLCFHGALPIFNVKCPKCGEEMEVPFKLTGDMIKYPAGTLPNLYAKVSSVISYDDFLKFTISDFDAFVQSFKDGKQR